MYKVLLTFYTARIDYDRNGNRSEQKHYQEVIIKTKRWPIGELELKKAKAKAKEIMFGENGCGRIDCVFICKMADSY